MRLLAYSDVSGLGGSEVLVRDAIRAALQTGAEVRVLAVPGGGLERLLVESGDLPAAACLPWPFPIGRGEPLAQPGSSAAPTSRTLGWRPGAWPPVRLLGFIRSARRWARLLRADPPDIIFINQNGWESIALGARMARVGRIIGCYHLSVAPLPGGRLWRAVGWIMQVLSMWSCHEVIHTSEVVRRQWCRRAAFPRARTRVILNGVEPGFPNRDDARRSLGWPPDRLVFCVPARLDANKGIAQAIEAMARISHTMAQARLVICGEGPERARLQAQAARRGLGALVEFLGWRPDLSAVLAASDCVILPSLHSENLSLGVLEGMMAGIPAIVTDVGGMTEAIEPGKTGWVVRAGSPDALAEAMREAATDGEERRSRGRQAREKARSQFTRERMLADYRRLFDSGQGAPA